MVAELALLRGIKRTQYGRAHLWNRRIARQTQAPLGIFTTEVLIAARPTTAAASLSAVSNMGTLGAAGLAFQGVQGGFSEAIGRKTDRIRGI